MTSTVEMVKHYQRSIDKSHENPSRLLHCIEKLHKLPVTVDHLKDTGIGRTVNNLRKFDGEVGCAAKALVTKWKSMVATEEPVDNASPEPSNGNEASPEGDEEDDDHEAGEEDEDDALEDRLQIDESENIEPEAPVAPEVVEEDRKRHSSSSKSKHRDRERHKSSHKSSEKHHRDDKSESNRHRKHREHHKEKRSSEKEVKKEDKKEISKEPKRDRDEKKERKEHRKRSSEDEKPVKKRKKDDKADIFIDSTMGASFADALGFLDMPSTSKKKKEILKTATVSASPRPSTSREEVPSEPRTPSLLTKKPRLEPLPDVSEIAPTLTISNNYRPLPLNPTVMECVYSQPKQRQMTDEEAFGYSISSKKEKTKVFSGQKQAYRGEVPTLFEMCIRLLQENIESLEYTGGIPFDILRPILDRATVEQLLTIEDFNPYLIEDTDILWEQHSKRRFRGKKPDELESWREMFLRCKDEEDAKLRALTENIKDKNQKKVPVKTTKLAYVDNYVKPPRNVQKKQVAYGTDRLPTVSPASRVASLNGVAANLARVGDTRLKVAAAIRDTVPTRKRASYDDDPEWFPSDWYTRAGRPRDPSSRKVHKTIDMIRYDRAKKEESQKERKKLKKVVAKDHPYALGVPVLSKSAHKRPLIRYESLFNR